jgi:polar amino acid transport system substrate-binding protein
MNRREIFNLAIPAAAAAAATLPSLVTPAAAQPAAGGSGPSTWDQIMSAKKLRVGAALLEPWYFKDASGSDAPGKVVTGGQTWRGICPAIAKATADAMGVQLDIIETTWGNAVAGLQSNQFDCMFMLDATPQRALSVDFVPTPMLYYPMSLIAKEDIAITNWAELNDPKYRIGVALGTNSDQYLSEIAPKAAISRFQNSGEIFAAFQSGRTDAGIVSATAADLARARLKMGKVIVPKPAIAVPGGIAVRKEADQRWLNYLNVVAGYFYSTGAVQKFYEEFLTFRGVDPKTAVSVQRELW